MKPNATARWLKPNATAPMPILSTHRVERALCVQAFKAAEPGDLALAVGDLVLVSEQAEDGWWRGSVGSRKGIFPGNHVELRPELDLEEVSRPPPAALRFAYDGAAYHEHASLHGLAAAYEGVFRLVPNRPVNGRPAYRHVERPDKWIAFNGSGWMAQAESALGTERGVLLLRDGSCSTPDLSDASWKVTLQRSITSPVPRR